MINCKEIFKLLKVRFKIKIYFERQYLKLLQMLDVNIGKLIENR